MSMKHKDWIPGELRPRPVVDCSRDKVITKQEFKDRVNINTIMDKARKGQQIDPAQLSFGRVPQYGDFSEVPDIATAHEIVKKAESDFYKIPAKVRERFGNDPVRLVAWLQDPDNRDMAVKYGLLKKQEAEAVEVQPEPAEGSEG